jgi:hypothetical protein
MFGSSVSLSANRQVLAVAGPYATVDGIDRAGFVQVLEHATSGWVARANLTGSASQAGLGTAIAVSDDGSLLVLGEPGSSIAGDRSGTVRTFRFDAQIREYVEFNQALVGGESSSFFGASVSLSRDRLAVGAPITSVGATRLVGQVYVYELSDGPAWRLLSPMVGSDDSDWFGSSVDLSEDGLVLVASAPENSSRKGYVRVWRETNGQWIEYPDITNSMRSSKSGERFGHALSVSKVETFQGVYRVAIGAPFKSSSSVADKAGAVLVYELVFGSGGMQSIPLGNAIVGDENEEVGYSLKLVQGDLLAIGSPGTSQRQGRVQLYRYRMESMQWEKADQVLNGNGVGDSFGYSVSFAQTSDRVLTLVVGATSSNSGSGDGYVTSFEPEG